MGLRFSRLGRMSIRRLRSGEKITEHGITAERMVDGDVRYTVAFMVDGQRINRTVGRIASGSPVPRPRSLSRRCGAMHVRTVCSCRRGARHG